MAFDATKPDGTPLKLLDVSRINALGWQARIPLRDGIQSTYNWFVGNIATFQSAFLAHAFDLSRSHTTHKTSTPTRP